MTATTTLASSLERETRLLDQLKERFGGAVKETRIIRKARPEVTVAPESIVDVARYLRDELDFDRCNAVSGADYLRDQKMEIVYHVSNLTQKERRDLVLAVKESVPRVNPKVKTLTTIWPACENFERETFEMYGVTFEGHPKLEKLFLLDNWDGPPPLRKDTRVPTD